MTRRRMPRAVGVAVLAVALAASAGIALSAATAGPQPDQATPAAASGPGPAGIATASPSNTSGEGTKQLIGQDTQWAYYYGAGYDRARMFADFRWEDRVPGRPDYKLGVQPIGFGSSVNTTELKSFDDSTPITAYFKTMIQVPDQPAWKTLRLTLRADDGAAVYCQGREVGRFNLPAGKLTDTTYATTALRTSVARADPHVIDIPVATLGEEDAHMITVELHANYRSTPDMSMELSAELIPDSTRDVLSTGSDWHYQYSTTSVPAKWMDNCELDNDRTGPSPLGFGSPSMATNLDVQPNSTRPLTAYFCQYALVSSGFGDLEITSWANDGIVLYVNGKEVKRANMPPGPVTRSTYATTAPRLAQALRTPITTTIPYNELRTGWNVIAAEVHLNWRGTPDMSFDLIAHSTGRQEP